MANMIPQWLFFQSEVCIAFTLENWLAKQKKWRTAPKKLSADCWSTVSRQSANCWPTVVYRLLRKSSATSRPTVNRLSADCWQHVGNLICWPSVGWEPLPNTRKASARREEHRISMQNETFSLESTILFRFFRYQTPHNPIASSSQSRSKNLFTAASCSFFFCFTKSEHYQLIFIIGHWLLKMWWLLKEPFLLQVKLHS